jgi:L-alanine-DL-glutamate epimerase-like enolase superfamily enzyme
VAAGEAYSGHSDYQCILDKHAVDVLQFDATHSGGMGHCIDLAEKAVNAGMSTAVHVWGSAVAMAANASVALASENVGILEYPMVPLEVADHMWVCKPKIVNGHWVDGDAPGLGVELTELTIEKYPFVKGSGYKLPPKAGA